VRNGQGSRAKIQTKRLSVNRHFLKLMILAFRNSVDLSSADMSKSYLTVL
jgi:hypothetical protein